VAAGGSTSDSGAITCEAIHAILFFILTQVFQFSLTSSCPRHPHHQFSRCSYFSIPYFSVCLLFSEEKRTKNNDIMTEQISEWRNSCSVKVGDVGFEGMMTAIKSEHFCETEGQNSMYSFASATTGFGGSTA